MNRHVNNEKIMDIAHKISKGIKHNETIKMTPTNLQELLASPFSMPESPEKILKELNSLIAALTEHQNSQFPPKK